MGDKTLIEWTEATWNPITGCSVISSGCKNCYAMKLAGTRLKNHPSRKGLTVDTDCGPVWNGEVRFNEHWLDQPIKWKKPRRIFVCAHGDLFHESVPFEWIDRVMRVVGLARHHTFQVLTKRSTRMHAYFKHKSWQKGLSNLWLGVSVENQYCADNRIPFLLDTPAAVRWVSVEPLLGPVDLTPFASDLDWVVVGGESGERARPMHPRWVKRLRLQCATAGTPFFFKQWGEWIPLCQLNPHDMHRIQEPKVIHEDGKILSVDAPLAFDLGKGAVQIYKVGKKVSGRHLDGMLWSEYPKASN